MIRRSFLGAMLAACAAPSIVRASSLMQGGKVLESGIIIPDRFAGVAASYAEMPWLAEGDLFTIAGVLNPSTNQLMQFKATHTGRGLRLIALTPALMAQ